MSTVEGLRETLVNLILFAYIGLLIWLYLRPEQDD